jgi:hypothetical protein
VGIMERCAQQLELSDNFADIDQIHLSPLMFVRRIDHDKASIETESRMRFAAPFSGEFRRRQKTSQRHNAFRLHMVKARMLQPFFIRIRIVQDPLISGQIAAMRVLRHLLLAYDFNVAGIPVFKEIEPVSRGTADWTRPGYAAGHAK